MEIKNKQRITVPEEVDSWLRSKYMNTYAEGYRECWDEFTYYREDNWPANEWEMRMEPYAAIKQYKEENEQKLKNILAMVRQAADQESTKDMWDELQKVIEKIQNYIGNGTE